MAGARRRSGRKKGTLPKTGGRQKGTPNRVYDTVQLPGCKECKSTDRSHYHRKRYWPLTPNDPDRMWGFTHRVERSCRCLRCGRWRWESFLECNPNQRAGVFACDDDEDQVDVASYPRKDDS